MAFDLNKSGEVKKKFDLSKTDESASANSSVGNSNSSNGNKKPSSWIFIVIAIALIGGGIWFFSSKHSTDLAKEQSTTAVVPSDSSASQVSTAKNTTSAKVDSSKVSEKPVETKKVVESGQSAVKPSVSSNSTKKGVESIQSTVKPSVGSNSQVSSLPQGTLEEKAKQVIRGDFGNGIERKNALGNEYKEIQKKVNEMYRKSEL
jgi:hypothetical protein